jgi:hypothetical protein
MKASISYEINNIEECIYDYLVEHKDELKSITKIYNSLINSEGIHCPELIKSEDNKNRFILGCYTLDRWFLNINKYFLEGKLYIMMSTNRLSDEEAFKNLNYTIYDDYETLDINNESFLNYIYNNYLKFDEDFDPQELLDKDNLFHLAVRHNRFDLLGKICSYDDISYDDLMSINEEGHTVEDIARNKNNTTMLDQINTLKFNLLNREAKKNLSEYRELYIKSIDNLLCITYELVLGLSILSIVEHFIN